MFAEVGMDKLIAKRNLITSYLEFVLHEIDKELEGADFEILTPANQEERGCQLSVYLHGQGRELFEKLMKNGVITTSEYLNEIDKLFESKNNQKSHQIQLQLTQANYQIIKGN